MLGLLLAGGGVVVFLIITAAIVVYFDYKRDRAYHTMMESLGTWTFGDHPERQWYHASKTCEGCLVRTGMECRLLPWPHRSLTDLEGSCQFHKPDMCPECGGWGIVLDRRYSCGIGLELTTGWWQWCTSCDRTGRVVREVAS